ncbi:MAG: hypothetical protein P4L46_15225 [Fimbriimonas sp.]|nr:hypothetical protein [Fimbriimonas sp.]
MNWFTRTLFGWEIGLTEIESACLDRFCEALPNSLQLAVKEQRRLGHRVIRFAKGKRVVLKYRSSMVAKVPSLPVIGVELHAATILLSHGVQDIYVEVCFDDGVLMGLEFGVSPQGLLLAECEFKWVRLLVDLQSGAPGDFIDVAARHDSLPTLRAVSLGLDISEVACPSSDLVIDTFMERLSCPVPDDFLALIRETNGFAFDRGRFYGTRARTIPWPDESLVLVAEDQASAWGLCFRLGEASLQVLILDQIHAELRTLAGSFVECLLQFAHWIAGDHEAFSDADSQVVDDY